MSAALDNAKALVDHTDEMEAEGLRFPATPHWRRAMSVMRALIEEHERLTVVLAHRTAQLDRLTSKSTDPGPVVYDPPLTQAEGDAYWDAISDDTKSTGQESK